MFHLKHNLPGWERALRLGLGLLLPAGAVLLGASGTTLWLAGAAGAMMALTGIVGFCPACAMLGRRP